MVSPTVIPDDTLPATVPSSSADPSLKTMSVASDTCERFDTLAE